MYNSPTSSGSQFCHNAHERMINRKPSARTKERSMTTMNIVSDIVKFVIQAILLSPAAIEVMVRVRVIFIT